MSAEPPANHFLESLLENIPATVFAKEAQHLRYVLNRAGEQLLGRSRADLITGAGRRIVHTACSSDCTGMRNTPAPTWPGHRASHHSPPRRAHLGQQRTGPRRRLQLRPAARHQT
ncbi:MAG TPA: hypothetical protein VNQ81_14800 [Povalibacter sp.]|nr:hypothetical protein [Povalibacter sp.]